MDSSLTCDFILVFCNSISLLLGLA
jgi:hypothetical protein